MKKGSYLTGPAPIGALDGEDAKIFIDEAGRAIKTPPAARQKAPGVSREPLYCTYASRENFENMIQYFHFV